jgi:FkbM family methyltransferase
MYVDPKDTVGEMAIGADWDAVTGQVFRRVIRPGDVVIDIGAHWGYFTLLAAILSTDSGKVYAFEPHPKNFALLAKNISANRLSNVVAIQKAVSNYEGEARLFESRASMGHSLAPLPEYLRVVKDSIPKAIPIDAVRLDDFFVTNPIRPRLVKMDIEGGEPSALEGMQALIKRSPELVLITEFNYQFLDANSGKRFLETLTGLGFETAVLDEERLRMEVMLPDEIVRRFLQSETRQVVNVLCTRGAESVRELLGGEPLKPGESRIVKVKGPR